MELNPMRYKDYIWPHNPHTYTISFERKVAEHKVPFGRYCMQDLGQSCRVLRGEGEFAGEGAYDEFKKLATVFYGGGPGLLVHPVWQISNAYFTALTVKQKPLPDYVAYSFEFRESFDGYSESLEQLPVQDSGGTATVTSAVSTTKTTHTVVQGDTLWRIANTYGITLQELLAANPIIKNPNLIVAGQKVVIP